MFAESKPFVESESESESKSEPQEFHEPTFPSLESESSPDSCPDSSAPSLAVASAGAVVHYDDLVETVVRSDYHESSLCGVASTDPAAVATLTQTEVGLTTPIAPASSPVRWTLPYRPQVQVSWSLTAHQVRSFRWTPSLRRIHDAANGVGMLRELADQIEEFVHQRSVRVAVASLRPCQGVSTVSLLTAAALGKRNLRTVVVDADWESPEIATYAGLTTIAPPVPSESSYTKTASPSAASQDAQGGPVQGWESFAREMGWNASGYTDDTDRAERPDSDATSESHRRLLEEVLVRDPRGGPELMVLGRGPHDPTTLLPALHEVAELLCVDRDCVILDAGILVEPPFDLPSLSAFPAAMRRQYLLAAQPRLASLRSAVDWLLLVRDPGCVSDELIADAVQEIHRSGIANVAVVNNFVE